MKYHHIGIPTTEKKPNEVYLEKYKLYVSGFEESPHGVEWMRFEEGCPLPEIVKTIPHVAFQVDDLEAAIAGKDVIIKPNSPSEGIMVAFIVENGAPVEYLEIKKASSTPDGLHEGLRSSHEAPQRNLKLDEEVEGKPFAGY